MTVEPSTFLAIVGIILVGLVIGFLIGSYDD